LTIVSAHHIGSILELDMKKCYFESIL